MIKKTTVLYCIFALNASVLGILSAPVAAAQPERDKTAQKAILVTGASTGIGRAITEKLALQGYYVYAGARKDKDLKSLDALKNVSSVRLDVTKNDQIQAAVETVSKAGRGLYGVVNNAGVAIVAPLIEVEESDLAFLFDVNIYGPYRITKAFAPMIIKEKGRITTIGSISGILSGRFFGPYSMSKHAIEAYTDSLAVEMQQFGVHVSVVEPGNYNSAIGLSLKKRMASKKIDFDKSLYKEQLQSFVDSDGSREKYKEPDEVADAVMDALFSEKPKRRYMVVPNKTEAGWTIGQAMKELLQLNQNQPYSMSEEELLSLMRQISAEL